MQQTTSCPVCQKPLSGRGKCKSYAHRAIGPRKVGGIYQTGYWGTRYTVLAISDGGDSEDWSGWSITVVDVPLEQQPTRVQKSLVNPTHIRKHCTAWDYRRDSIVSQPESQVGL